MLAEECQGMGGTGRAREVGLFESMTAAGPCSVVVV